MYFNYAHYFNGLFFRNAKKQFMNIDIDSITYEVFDKGFTIFRYYDCKGLVIHKKEYIFYTIPEAKQLFIQELNTLFL